MTLFRKLFGSRPEYNISWRSVDKPRKLKPMEPTFIIEISYSYKRLLYQYIPPFLISDRVYIDITRLASTARYGSPSASHKRRISKFKEYFIGAIAFGR